MNFKENLASLRNSLACMGLIFVSSVMIGVFFFGIAWASKKLLPWFSILSLITLALAVLVVLPLAIPRATRRSSSAALLVISYVFGATVWMKGFLLCLTIWGAWAVFIGVVLLGVGVVPIAILATIFEKEWAHLIELIVFTVLTFGARIGAIALR